MTGSLTESLTDWEPGPGYTMATWIALGLVLTWNVLQDGKRFSQLFEPILEIDQNLVQHIFVTLANKLHTEFDIQTL